MIESRTTHSARSLSPARTPLIYRRDNRHLCHMTYINVPDFQDSFLTWRLFEQKGLHFHTVFMLFRSASFSFIRHSIVLPARSTRHLIKIPPPHTQTRTAPRHTKRHTRTHTHSTHKSLPLTTSSTALIIYPVQQKICQIIA